MSRKVVLALLLIAAMIVTACAPATAPGAAAPAPAAGEQATATAEAAGEAAAPSGETVTLTIESWRNDDLSIWQDTIIPAFEAKNPGIKVVFSPAAAGGIQRRPQHQARRRHGRRPDHLPPLRRLAGAVREGLPGRPDRPARHGELQRRGQERLDDGRRQADLLRADGLGHPRLHLQQGHLRQAGPRPSPRPKPSSSPLLDKIKADGTMTPARHGHRRPVGSPPPWASRTSAPTTGRARKAARR